MAVFENWSLITVPAAEGRSDGVALRGEVVGHEHVPDGTVVTTGPLVHFDLQTRLARTGEATYRLGSIDLAFAPAFMTGGNGQASSSTASMR